MTIWLSLDDKDDKGVDVWLGVELGSLDEDVDVVGDGDVLL